MPYSVEGRHVLVTGASSGIGAALAIGFARHGAVVGICARRTERLSEVLARVREHSPASRMWTVDLAVPEQVDAFARAAVADLDGVDVLVNNAGVPKRRAVTALTPEVVEQVMAINYLSPVRLTLALLPGIVERRGRIVNVSSVAARLSPPAEAAYAASKAALTAWSESMAIDLRDTEVLVHVVNPGVVDTELFEQPDNDRLEIDIEPLAADALVDPVLEQLDAGTFEIYVPGWFTDVVAAKFPDVGTYLEGVKAFARGEWA